MQLRMKAREKRGTRRLTKVLNVDGIWTCLNTSSKEIFMHDAETSKVHHILYLSRGHH